MACVAEFLQYHGFSATLEVPASQRNTLHPIPYFIRKYSDIKPK
jgi:hypothetical protein